MIACMKSNLNYKQNDLDLMKSTRPPRAPNAVFVNKIY